MRFENETNFPQILQAVGKENISEAYTNPQTLTSELRAYGVKPYVEVTFVCRFDSPEGVKEFEKSLKPFV